MFFTAFFGRFNTTRITELIDRVVFDTQKAIKTTEVSIDKLGKGRYMIANLKNQSNNTKKIIDELEMVVDELVE